jgi:hypothetical protein
LRGALVAALAASVLAAAASSALAVIVHLRGGRALSYRPLRRSRAGGAPFDAFFSNLDYNGGPVMASNTNYAFYWAPAGAPAYPGDYQPGLNRYFQDLAHDSGGNQNVDSVSAQYNDAAGRFASYDSKFGGALIDTNPYPANGCARAAICLTDAQLQAELASFVTAHGLPHDLAHMYFVLTPPGVESCFEPAGHECSAGVPGRPGRYCAYHGNFALGGGELIYAEDPYVTGNEGCDDGNHRSGSSDGALQAGLSHEHVEAITDPEPNNARTDFAAGNEIGDKCEESNGAALGTALNGASYNQLINGHFYWYQEEWSNQAHRCLQRLTFSGAEPTATFTSKQDAGNEATFDASGSSAPGGVARYNWQFNERGQPTTPVETTTPTLSHAFRVGGFYEIALTVFATDGTSIGTARTILVGTPPAPVIKRVSPNTGPVSGHTAVTITGTGFTGTSAVHFGSASAESFSQNGAKSITAVSPAGSRRTVDVTVIAPWGSSAPTRRDHFKYR